MNPVDIGGATPIEWGAAVGVTVIVIKLLFVLVSKFVARDSGIITAAQDNQHRLLTQTTQFGRDDYIRMSEKFEELRRDVNHATVVSTQLREQLASSVKRGTDFYGRELPELIKSAKYRDYQIECNRDSINEARAEIGLPFVGQTPPHGVSIVHPPPVPQPVHFREHTTNRYQIKGQK